jgi:hypothetical protein
VYTHLNSIHNINNVYIYILAQRPKLTLKITEWNSGVKATFVLEAV